MKVILDNGHGRDTAGKRSPDGRLREYAYTREMARRIARDLKRQGIDVSLLVPEDTDVPLKERVERANRIYAETGKQAILVSIHVNAAGNGSTWFSARGWSVFVGIARQRAARDVHSRSRRKHRPDGTQGDGRPQLLGK